MSWSKALSEIKPDLIRWAVNYFGLALVLGVVSWLLWGEYQKQIEARFDSIERELNSYKDRVSYLESDALHRRTIEAEEQKQRAELFSAIERHLYELSNRGS